MDDKLVEDLKAYVLQHYSKTFKDKPILITEGEVCYYISTGKDKSPLILSKNVI
jgi:hypothetical protein